MIFVGAKPIVFPGSIKYFLYWNTIEAFPVNSFPGSKTIKINFTEMLIIAIFFQVLAGVVKCATAPSASPTNCLPMPFPCCVALRHSNIIISKIGKKTLKLKTAGFLKK